MKLIYQPGLHGIANGHFDGQEGAQNDVGHEHKEDLVHGRLGEDAQQDCRRTQRD